MSDSSSEIDISFPGLTYLIVGKDSQPVVAEFEGEECFLLYATRELAELYVEQAGGDLLVQEVNEDYLASLSRLAPEVPYFAWNALVKPGNVIRIPADNFRE